jgi:hypothetical protein
MPPLFIVISWCIQNGMVLASCVVKGHFKTKMKQRNILRKDNFLTPIYVYIGENENNNENNHKENIK